MASGLQCPDSHHFIAARVDDFHSDTLVLACREWDGCRPLECLKCICVGGGSERLRDLFPGILVREKCLCDAEAAAIKVTVEEPCRDFVGAGGGDRVCYGVINFDPFQVYYAVP